MLHFRRKLGREKMFILKHLSMQPVVWDLWPCVESLVPLLEIFFEELLLLGLGNWSCPKVESVQVVQEALQLVIRTS